MKECCETGATKKKYGHWVVLGLVAILAAILFWASRPRYYHHGGVTSKAKTDITAIAASLDEYSINNNKTYPTSLVPLVTPDTSGHCYLEGYNGKVPKDPWKHEYQYFPPTPEHPKPRVLSLGADGAPGGEGESADVDSDLLNRED